MQRVNGNIVVVIRGRGEEVWSDDLGRSERFRKTVSRQNIARIRRVRDWRDWPYFAGDGAIFQADGIPDLGAQWDDGSSCGTRLGTKETGVGGMTVPEIAEAAGWCRWLRN